MTDNPKEITEEVKEEEIQKEPPSEETPDLDSMSKIELNSMLVEVTQRDTTYNEEPLVEQISSKLKSIYGAEKKEAFDKYIEDGGEKDGFEYKDQDYEDFNKLISSYYKGRKDYLKNLSAVKEQNLEKKQRILDELRQICDGEMPSGLSAVKKLQTEWSDAEPIPTAHSNELWANYKALLDRYFNNRAVNAQLKELDKKKNYNKKLALCEKAEALFEENSIKIALEKLNDLHKEYKAIGPAPEDEKENLWERFKTASDQIYEKKREHQSKLKEEFDKNEEIKQELIEKISAYVDYRGESIKDWKRATEEVLKIQEEWKKSGPVGKKKAKDLSKSFWAAGKTFFKNKSKFYQDQEGNFEENLVAKTKLCEEAEAMLEEGGEEQDMTDAFIKLQNRWKEIGPAPRKDNDTIYKRFKTACDVFFERKRELRKEEFKAYEANLEAKSALCDSYAGKDLSALKEFIDSFEAAGEVPRKDAPAIGKRFTELCQGTLKEIKDINADEKEALEIRIKVVALEDDPRADKLIDSDRRKIKKEIAQLENDIRTWETNIEFFARSKNAEQLRADIDKKVAVAEKRLEKLKRNLRKINSLGR